LSNHGLIRTLSREPLIHFFVIAAVLFGVYGLLNPEQSAGDSIVLDDARLQALSRQFERTWQRAPTDRELRGLVESWIREELLYREGLAMGLAEGDPVVRRRLAQKMEFIAQDMGSADPDSATLRAFFEERRDQYRRDPVVTLSQVYFDPADHGNDRAQASAAAVAALAGGDPAESGTPSLLPQNLRSATLPRVAANFGQDFASALENLPRGVWAGPVDSSFGVHLVRIDEFIPGALREFDEVEEQVRRDYLVRQRERAESVMLDALRERHDVTLQGEAAALMAGADDSGQ
jgi:hypothetical protein